MAPISQAPTALLAPGRWFPPTRLALDGWLRALPPGPHTAAFDWDNTCIFNDIGDAALRYQLEHLVLWHAPAALEALCTRRLAQGGAADGRAQDLVHDVCRAYAALWPSIARGQGASQRGGGAHQDFRAKLGALYEHVAHGAAATPARTAQAYALVAELWAPATAAVLRRHLGRVVAWGLAEPLGSGTWRSASPGRAGHSRWHFATGVRPHAEVAALMAAMQRRNVTPWVVSASDQRLVRAAAAALNYPLAPAHILGIRPGGRHLAPITYRSGKVAAIAAHLPQPPLFVAGDALTDLEMLTEIAATQVRLVIHRPSQAANLAALHAAAAQQAESGWPRTLLQGRDSRSGAFVSAATWASIKLDAAGPSGPGPPAPAPVRR